MGYWPAISRYMLRCAERPAYAKAYEREHTYIVEKCKSYSQGSPKEAVSLHPHPTPYTLHPTPYTLYPTPYTLHPTPYTLHHILVWRALGAGCGV